MGWPEASRLLPLRDSLPELLRLRRCFPHDTLDHGVKICKINFNQAGPGKHLPDTFDALEKQMVCNFKCFKQAGILIDKLEKLLIWQANDRISRGLKLSQTYISLVFAARSFEIERKSDGKYERTRLFGSASNDRSGTGYQYHRRDQQSGTPNRRQNRIF